MERESQLKNRKDAFSGSDYLSSPTSVAASVWSQASGVQLTLGCAQRMNGKTPFGRATEAVLNFSQIGNLIIVQFSGHVAAFGPQVLGFTQNIANEDNFLLQTEAGDLLTT